MESTTPTTFILPPIFSTSTFPTTQDTTIKHFAPRVCHHLHSSSLQKLDNYKSEVVDRQHTKIQNTKSGAQKHYGDVMEEGTRLRNRCTEDMNNLVEAVNKVSEDHNDYMVRYQSEMERSELFLKDTQKKQDAVFAKITALEQELQALASDRHEEVLHPTLSQPLPQLREQPSPGTGIKLCWSLSCFSILVYRTGVGSGADSHFQQQQQQATMGQNGHTRFALAHAGEWAINRAQPGDHAGDGGHAFESPRLCPIGASNNSIPVDTVADLVAGQ